MEHFLINSFGNHNQVIVYALPSSCEGCQVDMRYCLILLRVAQYAIALAYDINSCRMRPSSRCVYKHL